MSLDQQPKVLYIFFLLYVQVEGYRNILKFRCRTLAFTSYKAKLKIKLKSLGKGSCLWSFSNISSMLRNSSLQGFHRFTYVSYLYNPRQIKQNKFLQLRKHRQGLSTLRNNNVTHSECACSEQVAVHTCSGKSCRVKFCKNLQQNTCTEILF